MQPYTVSALNEKISGVFQDTFDEAVNVVGEISNLKASANGHWYFTLKDTVTQIRAVMFKSSNIHIPLPRNGDQVEVIAHISFYKERGECQLVCNYMTAKGLGAILALLEARKKKLAAEGLFDMERKRPLPRVIQRVAIVTSSQGAALQDIIRIFKKQNARIEVLLFPSLVQGDTAGHDIAQQINNAHSVHSTNPIDVLIVTRGGGSTEDLLAFSDEEVVYAMAQSQIPTISAVGHEIDTSFSDLVADMIAPTPTASAMIICEQQAKLNTNIQTMRESFMNAGLLKVEEITNKIKFFSPEALSSIIQNKTNYLRQHIDTLLEMMSQKIIYKFSEVKNNFQRCKDTLIAISPDTTLKRGFTLVYNKERKNIIKSKHHVSSGNEVIIQFYDGDTKATIQ